MSLFYSTVDAAQIMKFSYDTFILADGNDDRACEMARILSKNKNCIHTVLLLKYNVDDVIPVNVLFPDAIIHVITIDQHQTSFLLNLMALPDVLGSNNIVIDISCIHTPEMFTLLKYFKVSNPKESIDVVYSIPFEYEFSAEPFTSYRSYYGNLKTNDLLGFGGISDGSPHSQMIVFLGFEGVLSSKVTEDIQYDELLLVNNLPSFFPKYKDISVINNYDLLTTRHSKLMYVPANNPYETFNFLDCLLQKDEHACVAPLSTKPVALGVCLYAIGHESLRVVYPMSEQYNTHSTNKVLRTSLYQIPLGQI